MRINKFLSDNGIASRRGADKLIEEGRVEINGKTATLGENVEYSDVVKVNGQTVSHSGAKPIYYVMNKPKGYVCTVKDDKGRKTVMDLLPPNIGKVVPVGRLDYDTEGLLIFTNDGELTYRLTNPKNEIPKTYVAKIEGGVTERDLNRIRPGIEIDGRLTKKCKIKIVETNKEYTKIHITITEGRNREIRKMFEAIGKNVEFLKRISIGEFELHGLNRGEVRKLTDEEIFYLTNL